MGTRRKEGPGALIDRQAGRGWMARAWRYFENSAVPLGVKWSLSIAALIVLTMSLLGAYLIAQQDAAQRALGDRYSRIIVDQLARSSGEPVMAGDRLALNLLLQRQADNPLILGIELADPDGTVLAVAGVTSPPDVQRDRAAWAGRQAAWQYGSTRAATYVRAVRFQDVTAGYLGVTFDRTPLERERRQTVVALVVSSLLLLLAGVLMAWLLAHRLSRPIEQLARTGAALGAGRPRRAMQRRDEIGHVLETFTHLAEGMRQREQAEDALARYLSPRVAQQALAGRGAPALGGRSVQGSVLFCDIVGFTRLAESRTPAEVAALLNDYFGFIALAAQSCRGTVDSFIGDAILVVFGVTEEDLHHRLHALTCGMLIQRLTGRLNGSRERQGKTTLRFRIGIGSGAMQAGNLGSEQRMQFTVVGDTVNIAARLCNTAEPGGVLLQRATLDAACPGGVIHYRARGAVTLRGRERPVEVLAMDVDAVAKATDADGEIDRILRAAAAA
jgi:adenylate cyclase